MRRESDLFIQAVVAIAADGGAASVHAFALTKGF
jgi:hypothetical protein